MPTADRDAPQGLGLALSKLGFHAAMRFAERLEPLGLRPPHVGVLQLVSREPGRSQQALATGLGIPPTRLVALIDELEARELLRRTRSATDRRVFELRLTEEGERMLGRVRELGAVNEAQLFAALTDDERATLATLLRRVADEQGLDPGVHPALLKLRASRRS